MEYEGKMYSLIVWIDSFDNELISIVINGKSFTHEEDLDCIIRSMDKHHVEYKVVID